MFTISCPSWFKDAPCSGMDSTFFSSRRSSRNRAVSVCNKCPNRKECLDHAISNNITIGVWGGKTGPELSRIVGQ